MHIKISVIIPTYNRPHKLKRAINSVLNQTFKDIEVIVVDDNNPNTQARKETEKVMNEYYDNVQVKYIKHKYNMNGSAARNTGFKNSVGKYIMLLDDDDEFLPCKAEAQYNCLESKDEAWGACYTKYKRLRNGKLDTVSAETREGSLFYEELCRNLFIQAGSNLMIRRNVFKELKGFNETFERNQDIEFTVRLLKKYKIAYVDVMGLVYYRHHSYKRQFDMDKITKHYVSTFKAHIEELSEQEKKVFYKMINLQLFRYKLISQRDIIGSYKMIKTKKVDIQNAFSYFNHLFYRKIFKKSCGFNLDKIA
ncbi:MULTISPECIES: glycosyltransferase family 2 protein [Clostridia]|uniref:glycosyltransferase family 2 protein n=1 Tax=Clostridia TaxID=186801 RepID=UPI000EA33030|nr:MULTISPECIES: glycosyltransferase family 2 protein [Clostridia]NBJ70846.1 glycosyltransferase family 2 protein [Roseburia sp. 1XD42-34]RKI75708.1 glycosyltransferase family 2 protein [Clostridium sp. 1xD42-85]